ncbi:MAG: sulfatase-like hydrolase/transferase [Phycisphaerae bacterium]|nr:sulfatase-like hydrolase/transferase [Phycisphaerae bacterium]
MNRRQFLQTLGAGLAAATVAGRFGDAAAPKKPNIVYILADDLGYADLGCYGQTKIKTPHIDRLAAEGMKFTQHYSGSPVCAPCRCTLMTGLHTGHAQVRNNVQVGGDAGWVLGATVTGQWPLEEGTQTVARILQEAGYATGAFGKWGLGIVDSTGDPQKQGFDHFYGYICQRQAHTFYPNHLWRDGKIERIAENEFGREAVYSHDLIAAEALKFIRKYKDRPFFCYVPFTIPHVALQAPEDSVAEYKGLWPDPPYDGGRGYVAHPTPRAAYAAMVSRMDRSVGEIAALLKELGLEENTLVIFTSDNGPTNAGGADSGFFENAGPLRGLKGSVYEGGIRVPYIARWPGKIKQATTNDHVSACWDFLPTCTDLAGLPTPSDIDGVSMLPTLLGLQDKQKRHDYLYWELNGQQAIRMGEWKAVRIKMGKIELYNLAEDIAEKNNVADKHPDIVLRMGKMFETVRTESEVFPLMPGRQKITLSTFKAIPKDDWKVVRVDSESLSNGKLAACAIDGDISTWWHTEWQDAKPAHPHEIVVDMGRSYRLEGFRYLPRTDSGTNGMIKEYAFYVADDADRFGEPVAKGRFTGSAKTEREVAFAPTAGRYFKLRALSALGGEPYTSVAELGVVGEG